MKIFIAEILLWASDCAKGLRTVPLSTERISVITGDSKTGKSSLTWIIDYCLGSGKCAIPVGLIRNAVGWFGLRLLLPNTEMIVARRNPGAQQQTSDLYWDEGVKVAPPEHPEKNARVEDFVNRMNQLGFLPSLDFSEEAGRSAYAARASFRDMAAFNFLPQHIVANPYALFFKTDTTEHREKLRTVFPLVTGEIDVETLSVEHQLRDLKGQRERLQHEVNELRNARQVWAAEIRAYYMQAREYGLLPNAPEPQDSWPVEQFVQHLARVPKYLDEHPLPAIQEGATEGAVTEIRSLVRQEESICGSIGIKRRKLSRISQLTSNLSDYRSSLGTAGDRIVTIGWFERNLAESQECPLCHSSQVGGTEELERVKQIVKEYSALLAHLDETPPQFDKEETDLRSELRDLERQVTGLRKRRAALEDATDKQAVRRQQIRQVYLFVGRVQQALQNFEHGGDLDSIEQQLKDLNKKVQQLESRLDARTRRGRERQIEVKIVRRIQDYARMLELEHFDSVAELNRRELSLRFLRDGRQDYLWEIGSAANWMGYHIATLLSLHEHFLTVPKCPVPSFLLIDQPSQVYFPEGIIDTESTDVQGVRRIFRALEAFYTTTAGCVQIVVTEHAGPNTWEGCPHVEAVQTWRHGDALIPADWVESD
jgi:uncharacterized coiled-coil DUF342 family protein